MIVYLHGFNSAPASHKARVMHAYMAARGVGEKFLCPALPDQPAAALAVIEAALAQAGPQATLVGSSLGGFYATWFAETRALRAVLVNPAITPHLGLASYLGENRNLYTDVPYQLTRAHLEAWRALVRERIDPERYLLLLETGDEVLDWRVAAAKYAGARTVIRDGGDHTLRGFPEHLPRILAFAGIAGTD